MTHLAGKTAFISGGSRGIGAAICLALARAGADIALTWTRKSEQLEKVILDIQATGRKVLSIQADAGDSEQVRRAVSLAKEHYGRIDILVNNAGNFVSGSVESLTLKDFDRSLDVNLRGVFVTISSVLPLMPDGGRIINIGSCLATWVGRSGIMAYTTSKAGLVGLTKGAARDLGPRKITVNVIQPGSIDTDMNPASGERAAAALARMALPAYGTPADIAGLVVFLAGEQGQFITGASFDVDGGINA